MTLANVMLGLTIGFPLMIIAGPLSMMLLDQGLTRGLRQAAPAVAGVAAADLVLCLVASIGGAAVATALAPIEGVLTVAAVLVLLALAAHLWRSARRDLIAVSVVRQDELVPAFAGAPAPAGADVGLAEFDGVLFDGSLFDESLRGTPKSGPATPGGAGRVAHLDGLGLSAAFFALTVINPLSLVLLGSIVVAGGPGVGTLGWAIGMAVASATAHGSYMVVGALIGGRLGPAAVARIRLGGAAVMVAMAAALYFGVV